MGIYLTELESKTGSNSYQESYYHKGNSIVESIAKSHYKTTKSNNNKT